MTEICANENIAKEIGLDWKNLFKTLKTLCSLQTSNRLKWYDFILCYFSSNFTLYQISKHQEERHLGGYTRSSLYVLTGKIAFVASIGFGGKQVNYARPLCEFTSRWTAWKLVHSLGKSVGSGFTHVQFNNPHVQNQCSKVSEDWYTLTDLCDAWVNGSSLTTVRFWLHERRLLFFTKISRDTLIERNKKQLSLCFDYSTIKTVRFAGIPVWRWRNAGIKAASTKTAGPAQVIRPSDCKLTYMTLENLGWKMDYPQSFWSHCNI